MENPKMAGYRQAWEAAAFFRPSVVGSLLIGGKDREAFIQRQTTNDVRRLKPESALLSVLTSPTARILDVLYLLSEQDQIRALTLASSGAATTSFLQSRIFFVDQVTVQDTSAAWVQIYLVGPKAVHIFAQAFESPAPAVDQVVELKIADNPVRFFAARPSIIPGGIFISPAVAVEEIVQRLESAGAGQLSPDAWEIFRVELGLPGPRSELNEEFTPLEIGLSEAISDSKGCYTGQEIIARQITYEKVTQHLRLILLEQPLEPGAQIRVEGKRAGVLTSAVISPKLGPIGLAVLKRPYHEDGTQIELETGEGEIVPAQVVTMPSKAVS